MRKNSFTKLKKVFTDSQHRLSTAQLAPSNSVTSELIKKVPTFQLNDPRQQKYIGGNHLYNYRGVSREEMQYIRNYGVLGREFKKTNTYSVDKHVKEANAGSNLLSLTPSTFSAKNFASKPFGNPFATVFPGIIETAVVRTSYSLVMVDVKESNQFIKQDPSQITCADIGIDGCMDDVDLVELESHGDVAKYSVKSYANYEAEWAQVSYIGGEDFRMSDDNIDSIIPMYGPIGIPFQIYNVDAQYVNSEFTTYCFSVVVLSPCPEEEAMMIEQAYEDAEQDSPETVTGKLIKQGQRPITSDEARETARAFKGFFGKLRQLEYEILGPDVNRTVPADLPKSMSAEYLLEKHRKFRDNRIEELDDNKTNYLQSISVKKVL